MPKANQTEKKRGKELKKKISIVDSKSYDGFARRSISKSRNTSSSREKVGAKYVSRSTEVSLESLVTDAVISALDELAETKPTRQRKNSKKASSRPGTSTSREQREVKPIKSQTFELTPQPKLTRSHVKTCYSTSSFDKTAAEFLSDEKYLEAVSRRPSRTDSQSNSKPTLAWQKNDKTVKIFDKSKAAAIKRTGSLSEQRRPAVIKPKLLRRTTSLKGGIVVKGNQIKKEQKSVQIRSPERSESIAQLEEIMFLPAEEELAQKLRSTPSREQIEEHITPVNRAPPLNAIAANFDQLTNAEQEAASPVRTASEINAQLKGQSKFMPALSESQLAAFRRLFSRFDQTHSGGISPAELYKAVVEMLPGREVTLEEVTSLLKEFDIKETGEIEFDEFLFAMIHPKNYLKLMNDDDREQLGKEIKIWEKMINRKMSQPSREQSKKVDEVDSGNGRNIFFTILKTATKKESMKEIRHFYVNRIKKLNDHVIHDWSAGQRCIGLSYHEMTKRYEHISRELTDEKSPFAKRQEYKDSPYAQPLRWGFDDEKEFSSGKRHSRSVSRKSIARVKSAGRQRSVAPSDEKGTKPQGGVERLYNQTPETTEIQFADEQEDLRRMRFAQRRAGTKRVTASRKVHEELQRTYSTPAKKVDKVVTVARRAASAKKRNAPLRRPRISEFVVTPKVVPLPKYPLQLYPQTFDYDDLPEIRQKAAVILEDYYCDLKKVAATNSRAIYKQLQVEQMRSVSRKHFKNSYLAYSGDYEPFVVSPWIPFPTPSPWIPYPPLGKSQPKQTWT